MDVLSVAVFRYLHRIYGECTDDLSHRMWYPPATKNGVKFDRALGLLSGGTYPLCPGRRRTCVDGITKVQKLNFGVGPDPPIRTYLRMCRETEKPPYRLGAPHPVYSDLRHDGAEDTTRDRNAFVDHAVRR